ncbi:CRISPR-associated helicase Cas3' [Pantanalinema rosaneae CENA516]|uniref:type I-G CRISPR-associated helicase/endonuclease Cas3g n=1 Tax=Pantanalinema rosaneae TaxID=1620701 RepID=UPI003D6F2E16
MKLGFSYATFFKRVTASKDSAGFQPFPFQLRFSEHDKSQSVFCEIPTGLGKTYMVLIDWLWGRLNEDRFTPRRLVFVLPLRTLVEQVYGDVERTLQQAGMADRISVYMLMGGVVELDFDEDPTRECVLIGTLDQVLSRQLMRAYSCNRTRFPKQFAYLHNDCRIVCDETQLMGAGFLTSAVLQEFRDRKGVFGNAQTIWMSATLDRSCLNEHQLFRDSPVLSLELEDWENKKLIKRLGRTKRLEKAQTVWDGYQKGGVEGFTRNLYQEVVNAHKPGTLTLIILNTTAKAIALYRALLETFPNEPIELLHSRFRPPDRAKKVETITDKRFTGIIVSTQCVEAGVDLDARVLFTELAPWASLVQRFGRCGRRGAYPDALIYWIDAEVQDERSLRPYSQQELDASRTHLLTLPHAGIQELLKVEAPKQAVDGKRLDESTFRQLFDTTLREGDPDVARYIRKIDALNVSIAWRKWQGKTPNPEWEIHRDELCSVPCDRFEQSEIRECWVWNDSSNQWQKVTPKNCKPGQTVLLPCSAGGYLVNIGWTGRAVDVPEPIPAPILNRETNDTDYSSFNRQWVTLRQHSMDAAEVMKVILVQLEDLNIPPELQALLVRSAQWHDLGKSHPVFQQRLCIALEKFWSLRLEALRNKTFSNQFGFMPNESNCPVFNCFWDS